MHHVILTDVELEHILKALEAFAILSNNEGFKAMSASARMLIASLEEKKKNNGVTK